MKYFFHEAAEVEYMDAVDFYESCQTGLGGKLFNEIQTIIRQICEAPQVWEKIDNQTHRCLTNRFPYAVLYRVKSDHIRIIAIMHLRQKPDYWKIR